MKYIVILLIILMFLSCKNQQHSIECGTYRYRYKVINEKEELILKRDSTFSLYSYGAFCSGRWKSIKKNTILINCSEEVELMERLRTGYMNLRQREIKILSKNRLKLPFITGKNKIKYVILEREK